MSDFEVVRSITDNLRARLQNEGIRFFPRAYNKERHIPGGIIPFGEIFYQGAAFEYAHGQRPGYAEVDFLIRVILNEKEPESMMREQQRWVHRIREALTVEGLNSGDLAADKQVSRVSTDGIEIVNRVNRSFLNCRIRVRYRRG